MMRPYLLKGSSVPALALGMYLCLAVAEPHNSGLGGQSIALYAKAKGVVCKQTTGTYTLPENLEPYVDYILNRENTVYYGNHLPATPGDIRSFWGLLLLAEQADLVQLLEMYKEIFAVGRGMPTSSSFSAALLESSSYSELLYNFHFDNWLDNDMFFPLEEGDQFQPIEEYYQFYYELIQFRLNSTDKALPLFLRPNPKEKQSDEFSREEQAWPKFQQRVNPDFLIDGEVVTVGKVDMCVPKFPHASAAVANALKGAENLFLQEDKPIMRVQNYKDAFDSLVKVYKYLQKNDTNTKKQRKVLKRLEKIQRERNLDGSRPMEYGANMFAIVDRRTQESIVMVGSMGSSLGSMIIDGDGKHIENNFLLALGHLYSQIGADQNMLQPLIAIRQGKIALAWAGCGGFLTKSMDMARMLFTVAFNLFLGTPIEEAITTPLVYPVAEYDEHHGKYRLAMERTPGIPWRYLSDLSKNKYGSSYIPTGDTDEEEYVPTKMDRAVAVEQTSNDKLASIYFDGGGKILMPTGL